jgi:outer membrane protein assembly factor BamB
MDANIGSQVWTPGVGSRVVDSPAVDGNSLCVGTAGDALYALDASDGSEVWRFQTSRTSLTPMSARAGDQPARRQRHCRRDCLHQRQGQDRAFSLGDGSKLATVRLTKSRIDASVAVSDGMAYIAAENGFVYGLG